MGKAVAQLASNTRTANESPHALARGGTDFSRTAERTISGHRRAFDSRAQAKRDGKAARKPGSNKRT
jgi:hypothetical protein